MKQIDLLVRLLLFSAIVLCCVSVRAQEVATVGEDESFPAADSKTPVRDYHHVGIPALAAGDVIHTHISVEGWVTYTLAEEDGDFHVRICDRKDIKGMDRRHCVVGEIVPLIPLPHPKVGEHIRVRGIAREDRESNHGWFECHPVESWEPLP